MQSSPKSSERFDLSDQKLNLENGGISSWGNLGYWMDDRGNAICDYPSAAAQLAHRHAQAAQLSGNSVLLDLACGCGDQLLLWRQHYAVERITAVNLSRSQTHFARLKLERAGLTDPAVQLHQADAVSFLAEQQENQFDVVMAVDGAYHFQLWEQFLESACRVLKPNGRLVISTLAIPEDISPWRRLSLRPALALAGITAASTNSTATQACLTTVGIKTIEFEDITKAVFAGFARWWPDYARRYAGDWPAADKLRYQITSHWLTSALRRGWPRYQLLTAVKR